MPSRPCPGLSRALPEIERSHDRGRTDDPRRDRILHGVHPALVDFLERTADPDPIDVAVGRQPSYQHRDVVFAALAVDHVGEEERLAVLLRDAAAKLPPHQRVHFGILVDRPVDGDQLSGRRQRPDMIVQVRIGGVLLPATSFVSVWWWRPRYPSCSTRGVGNAASGRLRPSSTGYAPQRRTTGHGEHGSVAHAARASRWVRVGKLRGAAQTISQCCNFAHPTIAPTSADHQRGVLVWTPRSGRGPSSSHRPG